MIMEFFKNLISKWARYSDKMTLWAHMLLSSQGSSLVYFPKSLMDTRLCHTFQKFQYLDFQLKNVWIMCICWNLPKYDAWIRTNGCFLLNILHLELNCAINQHCFIHFVPNMLRLAATIWECPDFLPEMSGILDTRIPTYCNTAR